MRIGILETGKPDPEALDTFGSYADMFLRLFLSIDPTLQFTVYDVTQGQYPEKTSECDAWLITGSKFSVYDNEPWIKELENFIVTLHQQRKKLVGICFGHQLIAQALGGKTEKSERGWGVGNVVSKFTDTMPSDLTDWKDKSDTTYSLLMSHQDQVVKLPTGATQLAGNAHCPNDSFQIGNHILTFQGHPEFTEDYLNYSMNKRRDRIGEDKYNNAKDSMKTPHEGKRVAQWLLNFMEPE